MAQLKSTLVQGALTVTGNAVASKLIKNGGTSDDILLGDGSTTSKSALMAMINAAVTIKGTLGTGGTITSLPTASASNLGYGYKVITAGKYNNVDAKVGDMFICYKTGSSYAWMHIPSGDDIEDTWRPVKVNDTQILDNGNTTGAINLKAGTNVSITNSGGTVTFTATDTGATSIETTGSGNAVTSGSYDAATRKVTLTKGNSFLPLSGGTLTGTLGFKSNYLIKPVADYRCTTSSLTGAITITLPAAIGNTMVSMWIDVYNYVTNTSFSVHVGGYTYDNSTWANRPFAMVYGADHKVRLGHNGTNFVIYIGELASSWSYPQISVRDVILGYGPTYANWYKDWTISFTSDAFKNVTATLTDKVWTTKNLNPSNFQPAGKYVTLDTEQTITAKKTFDAPAKVSGEQATTVFKTANGGSITIGKEGNNEGTMLRFDQTHGTCRLRFRASSSTGAMVWEQPESNSTLCLDVSNVDFRNTTGITLTHFKSAGYLYTDSNGNLKSAAFPTIPTVNNGTLTIQKNGTNIATFTANQSGNSTANITVPTKTSDLTNDSKFITAESDTLQSVTDRGATTTKTITALSYNVNSKSTIQYNTTEGCLEFVFA